MNSNLLWKWPVFASSHLFVCSRLSRDHNRLALNVAVQGWEVCALPSPNICVEKAAKIIIYTRTDVLDIIASEHDHRQLL